VEAHLLSASACGSSDERKRVELLKQAVALAAPETIVAPFLEHGEMILREALQLSVEGLHRSLEHSIRQALARAKPSTPNLSPPKEPLSAREREVLHLVAQGLSNAEVGRHLFVAPSTVKKHLEHIYDKLGVRRRTQAVVRARALQLVR
jgi:LuxR family maltose regulon positive regulatory protein